MAATSIVFYHFEDDVLMDILEGSETHKFRVLILPGSMSVVNRTIDKIVYETQEAPNIQYKGKGEPKVLRLDAFVKELDMSLREEYFFQRFCLEQHIAYDDVDADEVRSDILKESSENSFENVYAHYVSARTANVHVLETDIDGVVEDKEKYAHALGCVFNTKSFSRGDVVIVRKCLSKEYEGQNEGRFMFDGRRVETLDYHRFDAGTIGYPVISEFPICYWSNFVVNGNDAYNMFDHNSIVWCNLSPSDMRDFKKKRNKILEIVQHMDEKDIDVCDRVIILKDNDIKYGFISEFGLTGDHNERKCSSITNVSDDGFYAQYPRFDIAFPKTGKYCLVKKRSFVKNMKAYKDPNPFYKSAIDLLLQHGVQPNNIAFIDSGFL